MPVSINEIKAKKLLIVEDIPGVLLLLSEKFRHEGFKVFAAENGEKGLEYVHKHKPDLVLTDILMPVMDGIEMMRKVRKGGVANNVPVVFLSILSEKDFSPALRSIGNVLGYFWKNDLSLHAIVHKVKLLLDRADSVSS
jgi:two-component system, OmpR family, alkaline phosphatase synthesis response regulator PhoP